MAFDASGSRLYVADGDTQRILEFVSGAGPAEFASLSQPDAAPSNPAGLAVAGNCLLLADAAGRAVRVYDTISRHLLKTIPLDFAPSRLDPLSDRPVFLLNGDRADEWLLVLDAGRDPQVYFVPAGPSREVEQ